MIGPLLIDLAPRVTHADAARVLDDTLSVVVDGEGPTGVAADESDTLQVRVAAGGRIGWAGGATAAAADVIQAALRSAESSDAATLLPPAPAPLPSVVTRSPAASSLSARDLLELAGGLMDRLQRRGRRVEVWAERSAGSVEVANTRGVSAAYEVTLAGLGVTVQDDRTAAVCRVHLSQVGAPGLAEIESIVRETEFRLGFPVLEDVVVGPSARVWFRPRAVRALLAPVLARLAGQAWIDGRQRWPVLDARLTLIDDPLADGRPASRPISDDGVVARRVTLIEAGVPRTGAIDLGLASATRLPATGHGRQRGYAAPRVGFSNLVMLPGPTPVDQLGAEVGDGLLVADLVPGSAPNPAAGGFRAEAPWTYLVAQGRVVGRVEGAVLSGDVFAMLNRVVAIGAETDWIGAWRLPSLVLDGVGAVVR